MRLIALSALLAGLALAGCAPSAHTVQVRITPNTYQVGEMTSSLATTAVNEVVRLEPQRVLMLTCVTTPPARIIRFEQELRARNKAQLQGTFTSEGCAA